MMLWTYLYTTARNNARLRTLSDADFRIWFNLVCLAREQGGKTWNVGRLPEDVLAIEVANGDSSRLRDALETFSRLGLVSGDEVSHDLFVSRLEEWTA